MLRVKERRKYRRDMQTHKSEISRQRHGTELGKIYIYFTSDSCAAIETAFFHRNKNVTLWIRLDGNDFEKKRFYMLHLVKSPIAE